MSSSLPEDFSRKMQSLLGEEYSKFAASYLDSRSHGLRVNSLKLSAGDLPALVPFNLRPVPWCPEGYYYDPLDRPGKHCFHAAGLYYIQEPSAMAVVEVLNPQPGERVLDLSAAPGGKATHIGARLRGQGLLVANEPVPGRAKILAENLERFGVTNSLVLNEYPQKLLPIFPEYFDKILLDAPCSGEGMFRKEPSVCLEWSLTAVSRCAQRQLDILQIAQAMLRPGGSLVYSTCTFSPEENEQVIEQILKKHARLRAVSPAASEHFSPGRPEWAGGTSSLASTLRLWPHRLEGEGHFIALLRKDPDSPSLSQEYKTQTRPLSPAASTTVRLWEDFAAHNLENITVRGEYVQFAEYLYLLPQALPDLGGTKITRPGWLLGVAKKNRFEPGHALALGISAGQCRRVVNLAVDSPQVLSYLQGHPLRLAGEKGWTLVTVAGFPLGWGKHDGHSLKNHYPKGLRWPQH